MSTAKSYGSLLSCSGAQYDHVPIRPPLRTCSPSDAIGRHQTSCDQTSDSADPAAAAYLLAFLLEGERSAKIDQLHAHLPNGSQTEGIQMQSEVIRGHQRSSEVLRGHQRSSVGQRKVIRGHQRSSEAIRGHQKLHAHLPNGNAIGRNHGTPSDEIRRDRAPWDAIRRTQRPTCPFSSDSKTTFSGLMSRWTMPREWRW